MTSTTEGSAQLKSASPPDERLVGVSLAGLKTQHPTPVDLWNAKGMLLLRKGEKLESLESQQMLSRHQPSVRESDLDAWRIACKASLGTDEVYWMSPSLGIFVKNRLVRDAGNPFGAGTQEAQLVMAPMR